MTTNKYNIVGIDYGSKLAGTTVIAHLLDDQVNLYCSKKKKSADIFILDWIKKAKPDHIFIDAPLSLPGVYQERDGFNNYFYRQADQELNAMSPMFLGGLTARAMKLKKELEEFSIQVHEVYPAGLVREGPFTLQGYKKQKEKIQLFIPTLESLLNAKINESDKIENWHQIDAILALCSGVRFLNNSHLSFGSTIEGQIII